MLQPLARRYLIGASRFAPLSARARVSGARVSDRKGNDQSNDGAPRIEVTEDDIFEELKHHWGLLASDCGDDVGVEHVSIVMRGGAWAAFCRRLLLVDYGRFVRGEDVLLLETRSALRAVQSAFERHRNVRILFLARQFCTGSVVDQGKNVVFSCACRHPSYKRNRTPCQLLVWFSDGCRLR